MLQIDKKAHFDHKGFMNNALKLNAGNITRSILTVLLSLFVLIAVFLPLLGNIAVSAQSKVPDTCPGGQCPLINNTEIREVNQQEGITDLVGSVARFVIYIAFALAIIATPILIIAGIIFLVKKRYWLGGILVAAGPVFIIICILIFTIISILTNLSSGDFVTAP